jgi:hypothetical protein
MEMTTRRDTDAYARDLARITTLARGNRERTNTTSSHTVARFSRWWVLLIGLALGAAACGGGDKKRPDTYARASNAQEDCCENLTGPARDSCMGKLVRVDDPQVAATPTNQDTYACVMEHFVCDPSTGHATQSSAQAQLDCIQDLQ